MTGPKAVALPLPADAEDWERHAACQYEPDPDLWFPVGETGEALLQADVAKAVCLRCPALEACGEQQLAREGGIKPGQRYGVWGGMTPKERFAVYRARARQAVS